MKISRYKHEFDFSYTLGATLTYELLKTKPENVIKIYIRPKTKITEHIKDIIDMCKNKNIIIETSEKAFNILSPKENCFIIGVFKKEFKNLEEGSHVLLVNPSNAGNLGTIIRTCVGFGINNISIISPSVDYYDPKVVRASMGAIFHVNMKYYNNIEEYIKDFPKNKLYSFMLKSSKTINKIEKKQKDFTLVFGNEATGLPDEYLKICESVIIPHSKNIDSLNLPVAVSIAVYEFTKNIWQK